MPVWRLTPIADVDDGRWQGSDIWSEVLVQADSAAGARIVAAELDTPEIPAATQPNTPFARSRFADEKLYRVDRVDPADLPDDVAALARDPAAPAHGRILYQEKLG